MNMMYIDTTKQVMALSILLLALGFKSEGAIIPLGCPCRMNDKSYEMGMIRIIGGDNVQVNEFPFMAGLFEANASAIVESVECGAAIISPSHLLTAAHCINPSTTYSVVAGVANLYSAGISNIRNVSRIEIHPDFDEESLADDLALLTLDQPLDFNSGNMGPACIGLRKRAELSEYTTIGWGYERNATTSLLLKEVTVEEYDYLKCHHDGFTNSLKRKQFCTLSKDKGPCQGDSGGPVLWFDEDYETYTLVGIISKGPENCRRLPTVHTDLQNPEYLDWINQKTKEPLCFSSKRDII